jgi:hypothetical protein
MRVNGTVCSLRGPLAGLRPGPPTGVFAFDVPPAAMNRGYNLIELRPGQSGRIVWVEFAVLP